MVFSLRSHTRILDYFFSVLDVNEFDVIGVSKEELAFYSKLEGYVVLPSKTGKWVRIVSEKHNKVANIYLGVISKDNEEFEPRSRVLCSSRVLEHLWPSQIQLLDLLYESHLAIVPDMKTTLSYIYRIRSVRAIRSAYEIVNQTQLTKESIMLDSHKWFTCEATISKVFDDVKFYDPIEIGGYYHLVTNVRNFRFETTIEEDITYDPDEYKDSLLIYKEYFEVLSDLWFKSTRNELPIIEPIGSQALYNVLEGDINKVDNPWEVMVYNGKLLRSLLIMPVMKQFVEFDRLYDVDYSVSQSKEPIIIIESPMER